MPGPKCIVAFCKNRRGETKGVGFYRLTAERYESWMRAVGRDPKEELSVAHNAVCSDHFTADSFIHVDDRKLLKRTAIPTINLRPPKPSFQKCLKYEGDPSTSQESETPGTVSLDIQQPSTSYCHGLLEISKDNSGDPSASQESESADTVSLDIQQPSTSYCHGLLEISKDNRTEDSSVVESLEELNEENVLLQASSSSLAETVPPRIQLPQSLSTLITRKRKAFESSTTDSEGLKGSPKRRRKSLRTFHNYTLSPRKLGKHLKELKDENEHLRQKLKISKARTIRLTQKIEHLKDIVFSLKDKKMMSDDALAVLEKSYCNIPLQLMKRLVGNLKRGKSNREQFPEELRSFALTLQFYSTKAYEYIRETFKLALPSPSVIRSWMSGIDCEPGFSGNAFNTLKEKVRQDRQNGLTTICALMLDEIAIKKQIDFVGNKTWGYVDLGTNVIDDQLKLATEALVLMVVSLNSHWKLSIAYFLISGLTGKEKANIVNEALQRLHDAGVVITSVTCDGPSAHFAMARELGAVTEDVSNITPYFPHPSDDSLIFIVFDPCHMLKLLRNNWAALGQIYDGSGNLIDFSLIAKLFQVQEAELLRFGTKLKKAHLNWQKQKMKVNLAAQTLSSSVADALEFLMDDIKHPDFKNAKGTINFIRLADRLFDLCNSRNAFGRGCKTPLRKNNEHYWRPILEDSIDYLKKLRTKDDVPLYMTRHKTPIKGFIITALSLLGLYDTYVKDERFTLKYLLTYKLSQDHLELFFFNIRSRNGSNNNPTAFQFFYTFKRLILEHDLKLEGGNCISQDATSILHIRSTVKHDKNNTSIDEMSIMKKYNLTSDNFSHSDHDYVENVFPGLTLLSENVITYIAGFVVKKVKSVIKCNSCILKLEYVSDFSMDDSYYKLYNRKNRGGLIKPSHDVVKMLLFIEKEIRMLLIKTNNKLPAEKNFFDIFSYNLYIKILQQNKFFTFHDHAFENCTFGESHTSILIKAISLQYLRIRFYSIAKRQTESERGELIRKTYSKLVLFKHQ